MTKILLVDDELLIRTTLKNLIQWEAWDFTLIGEACNGQQALQQIHKYQPDIVIMDMKMPIMNGYQLSTHLHTQYPLIQMIVLSNYDDFEYVKGTLKNGALDYILKHTLNKTILYEVLCHAKECLTPPGNDVLAPRTLNNIAALKEKFISQLLSGYYTDISKIKQQINLLDINLHFPNILPIVMELDNYDCFNHMDYNNNKSLIEYSIINITNELLKEKDNGILSFAENKQFSLLLSFQQSQGKIQIDYITTSILNTVSSCLNRFLEISVSFSIGRLCENYKDLPENYKNASLALNNKFYLGKNCIINNYLKNQVPTIEDLTGLSLQEEKEILYHLNMGDFISLDKNLTTLFSNIKRNHLSINGIKMIFFDLLNIIIQKNKENNIDSTQFFSTGLTPHEVLSSIDTIDECEEWIRALFKKLLQSNEIDPTDYNSNYISEAVSFMKQHYNEDISLPDAARQLGIGSTYLSRLFKDEVGIGFSEYLGNLRINKAKLLLSQHHYKTKDVAKLCGYHNYDYFSKFFKKKVGVTPKNYKE